jgi:hypothetical protein
MESSARTSAVEELRQLAERAVADGRVDIALPHWERLAVLAPDDAHNWHNLVLGCLRLSERHHQAGDLDRTSAILAKAASWIEHAPQFKTQVSRSLSTLANRFLWESKDREAAIRLSRLSVVVDRDDGQMRINHENILSFAVGRAELLDFSDDLRTEDLAPKIFIACFPKSGSTFLNLVMQALTGFEPMVATYGFWENEQELYLPSFLHMARTNAVVQIHAKASMPNIHILQAFRIRPVLLLRNVFDVLLSWKEFLDGGAWVNTYCKEYLSLSDADRLDYVVDERTPWYLQFFASWSYATANHLIDARCIVYREMSEDKLQALRSICDWYALAKTDDEIAAAIERVETSGGTRFNKGIVGRGAGALTEAQKTRIAGMAGRYYPSVDFSMIGLSR